MFKWLVKLLIKPVIKPIKKAIELCDKLTQSIDKLVTVINGLPLEQSFKDEIVKTLTEAKAAIGAVKSVLIKVLETAGEDTTIVGSGDSISKTIEDIKSAL